MLSLDGFKHEGGNTMSRITPKPNDPDDNVNRLKKTISNMEAAEAAMEFAEGKELASIEEKNERRKESIERLKSEISEENKSRINGYL